MKKVFTFLMAVLGFAANVSADVEWTIWEGSVTGGNVQGASKLDFSVLEAGDMIYVYGTGTLSKAIYRLSGNDWSTWTHLESYSPAVADGNNYYHVITSDFLTNFDYSSDETKSWAVGNWDEGTITKVTIRKGKSMIKTTLSDESKSSDANDYNITADKFASMVAGDYLYLSASKRSKADEKSYKVEFKEGENDWTTYTTLWGPTHDAIWQVGSSAIDNGIKDHPLYVYAELYNTAGVAMYHPVSSFSIGSIGYATFSANQEVTAPASVKAYRGTVSGDKLVLTPFTGNVIPANTGAIIAGDEGAVLEFTASSTAASESSELIACTSATDVTTLESGFDYYVLYAGKGKSESGIALSTLLANFGNWKDNISWNPSTYTLTYTESVADGSEGGWGGFDWSGYDALRLTFSNNTLNQSATFYVAYSGHDDATTSESFSAGATSVTIPLNTSYNNSIGNISIYTTSSEGELTFESAALIDNDGATVAEFRKTTSGTLAANKAYLKIAQGSPTRLSIAFEDDVPTGISTVEKSVKCDDRLYNLNGQVVKRAGKGLYIKNGKKYLIK